MKILSVRAESVHVDGHTNRYEEANSRCTQFRGLD